MIALTPKQEWRYVLEAERKEPKDKQTIFKLRCLTGAERAVVKDAFINPGYHGGLVQAVCFALLGWENLRDANGKEVEFKPGKDTASDVSNLDYLDDAATELGLAILNRSKVDEADSKN